MNATDDVTIRKATQLDQSKIMKLVDQLNELEQLDYSLDEDWFSYVISDSNFHIYIVLYNLQIVGLGTMIYDNIENVADINIIIHPYYRNKGIGSLFYQYLLASNPYGAITLQCVVNNRLDHSVNFVLRRGFEPGTSSWKMEMQIDDSTYNEMHKHEEIQIRKAYEDDAHSYVSLINSTFGYSINDESFTTLFNDPSIHVYFICRHNRIIGTISVEFRKNVSIGYIYDIAVSQEFRGRGFGSSAIVYCMEELKKQGIKKAVLLVEGENEAALSLYQRLGFVETEKITIYRNDEYN
ncbi:MAG: GNAT family N-acetyltransferase [Clostridia bacterium]